ncbi:Bug family tripartite tricarboxylate transporter substrate binding protein [Aquabacter spiritensis]|uniref:Tripartite-type tricarboxylate transporter receptor subunit TctC n=1 Tax=Aquabacter spiritensis TaxID=933073 RepID=A0A4R3M8C2_9HYPH|nr:tripartite tricarboxylate transporter substrate-binding protein [Aquabacter spiritensis]TCT07595.1 tripartite-type tricarboxylate transporter receptor subunit TctC [Aquabacter spiritensis]
MLKRRDFLISSAVLFGAAVAPSILSAAANDFPNRPIKMIVPFAPGGGVDVFARLIAKRLGELKGYTVVVDNRSGANGSVGGNVVRKADPDGYTILFSAGTHVMAASVMKTAPYDPIADFTPIALAGEAPMMLVMSPKQPETTIAEIVANARQKPDQWNFAASAMGSPGHLATLEFNRLAKLDLNVIPYRGTAPGLMDVAGGNVQLMIDPVVALLPSAQAGNVKAVALTSAKRSSLAPDVPTAAESGLPGLDLSSWYGVWGPKNLPADLVKTLNADINETVRSLADSGQLAKIGVVPLTETPAQFDAFERAYLKKGSDLLAAAKFEPT